MRKNYIDNIRNGVILLLFPVHTFMIWNDFGKGFYIWAGESRILSTLIVLVNPWFMPILFVLAGISARYALQKRSVREFAIERIQKLLIPFLGGLVLLVPFQTLYARKYLGHYEVGIVSNWIYFFTHLTDFSGYDGAFTPGHLWFILFLFLISMVSLALFRFLPCERVAVKVEKLSVPAVLGLFLPIWLLYYLGNFGGFSLGKNLALYLIGYYVLSNDQVMEKLDGKIGLLVLLYAVETVILGAAYYSHNYYGDLWVNFVGWNGILALLVLGRKFWNKKTAFTEYFRKASYPIYILHQSILVSFAYYVVKALNSTIQEAAVICVGSFLLSLGAYYLLRKIPYLKNLIGA